MPLQIVRNDITKMNTDAIVNAANSGLKMGGGVCGAIFRAAGPQQLQDACDRIGYCAPGEAVHTDGFALVAKWIIHTVGPVWQGGSSGEETLLSNCYRNSLKLARSLGCESIAFPLISTGIYGYPKEPALRIAVSEIESFLKDYEMDVFLVVFDRQSFGMSEKNYRSIAEFINDNEVTAMEEKDVPYRKRVAQEAYLHEVQSELQMERSLEEVLKNADEPFAMRLLRFIDEKGMTDPETYRKANIDKKLFSKIKNSRDYTPKKKTAVAFAIALELDLSETEKLLEAAGYTLSRSYKFDLIILYFIEKKNYNINDINEALFAFDQELLGV